MATAENVKKKLDEMRGLVGGMLSRAGQLGQLYLPKTDYRDADLEVFSKSARDFTVQWESSVEQSPDYKPEENDARACLAIPCAALNIPNQISEHLQHQFNLLAKGGTFNEKKWEKPFEAAKNEIAEAYRRAVGLIDPPRPAVAGPPPVAAETAAIADERIKATTACLDSWKTRQLAEINKIQSDVLSQQTDALSKTYERQEFNAKSNEMMMRLTNIGLDQRRFQMLNEKPLESLSQLERGRIVGLAVGGSIYTKPPEDGIYDEYNAEFKRIDSASCLSVSGGIVTICGQNELLSRNFLSRLQGVDYEPNDADYKKMFGFIGQRMATDRVKIDLKIGDPSKKDGYKHLVMMINAAQDLDMEVTLGSKAQSYLANCDKSLRYDIERRIAAANENYERKQQAKEKDSDKLFDAESKRTIETQKNVLNKATLVAERGKHAGAPDAIARESAFLGFNIANMVGDPGPGPVADQAKVQLSELKERIKNLEKAGSVLNDGMSDLIQDVKQTQIKQADPATQAVADMRMGRLEARFNDLKTLRVLFEAEKADLASRLTALEGIGGGGNIHRLDPDFNPIDKPMTSKVDTLELVRAEFTDPAVPIALPLAPVGGPLITQFDLFKAHVAEEQKAEERETKRLGR